MSKQRLLSLGLIFGLLLLFTVTATGQDVELDTCVNVVEFPTFQRQQNVSEVEQIYQQINIERLSSGRPAYGYNRSLTDTANALAGSLVATPAEDPIPSTSVGDESTQRILEDAGYERWADDNNFIVEATRSVHEIGNQTVDDIVDTLFGNVGNRGLVQENARTMLTSFSYREIGIAVMNRPATREKIVVVIVGARPNEFPVVINFGSTTVTEYASILSFHNEDNRPSGASSPPILGRLLSLALRNPNSPEADFITVNWQPYCAFYPSNFAPGAPIDVEVQFTDLNGQQVITSVREWMPNGEPPIAEPQTPEPPTPRIAPITPTLTPSGIPPVEFILEAEVACTGGTNNMTRSNASGLQTRLVFSAQTLSCSFVAETGGEFLVDVRYTNDQGGGGAELLTLYLNGTLLEPVLQAVNTRESNGEPGSGWNRFYITPFSDNPSDQILVSLTQGESYTLEIAVGAGDGFGVEIDRLRFTPR